MLKGARGNTILFMHRVSQDCLNQFKQNIVAHGTSDSQMFIWKFLFSETLSIKKSVKQDV